MVLCLVIVNVTVTKNMCHENVKLVAMFFQAPNAPKLVFGRGSASDPAGGAYDAPQTP